MPHTTWGAAPFTITPATGSPFVVTPRGRERWALERLLAAGRNGCSPVDDPAPRWAAYVHDLRAMGVEIETVHETHGGPFPGTHARYRLACRVSTSSAIYTPA